MYVKIQLTTRKHLLWTAVFNLVSNDIIFNTQLIHKRGVEIVALTVGVTGNEDLL